MQDSQSRTYRKIRGSKERRIGGAGKAYKEIKSVQVAYLLVALFIAGAVILYSAGVFENLQPTAMFNQAGRI